MNIDSNTTFTQSENIVSCEFEPVTLAGLSERMVQHFDVEKDVCLSDIKSILSSFIKSGLIENVNDTSA